MAFVPPLLSAQVPWALHGSPTANGVFAYQEVSSRPGHSMSHLPFAPTKPLAHPSSAAHVPVTVALSV